MYPLRFALLALWLLILPTLGLGQSNSLLMDTPKFPVKALAFSGKTPDGRTIKLSDYKGKVLFLNFWATWCLPCLEEMPAMNRLNLKMQDKPFAMLAVNLVEEEARVKKFLVDKTFSFELLLDPDGLVSTDYAVANIPLTYILNQQGFIIHRALGPRRWDSDEAVRFFDELTGVTVPAAVLRGREEDGSEIKPASLLPPAKRVAGSS